MIRPKLEPEAQPSRRVLDNGAILVSRPTPDSYGVSLGVIVGTGTRDESPDHGGISHLLEHMVFKGTRSRSAFDLARDMEAIGAHLDAYTTKEHTGYTVRALPELLPTALGILSEMLLESTFPEDQLGLEKQVVLEEIFSSEDTPDDHVHEVFCEKLLGDHPLSRPILGTRETVDAIDRETLSRFAQSVHRGGNVILSVTGSVGPRELESVVESFPFPAGEARHGELRPAQPRPGRFHAPKKLTQQYVELGVPTVGANHRDRYAVSLLANILGGGMSSRLFQKVREQEGLAYSIYSYAEFHRDCGTLCTSFSASETSCQRALDVISQEYHRLRQGDLPAAEIELNKAQLVGSVVLGLEGSMNQMARLARCEMYYGRFVPLEEILADIDAIERDDLVRVAEQYLSPQLQTIVGHGPVDSLRFDG